MLPLWKLLDSTLPTAILTIRLHYAGNMGEGRINDVEYFTENKDNPLTLEIDRADWQDFMTVMWKIIENNKAIDFSGEGCEGTININRQTESIQVDNFILTITSTPTGILTVSPDFYLDEPDDIAIEADPDEQSTLERHIIGAETAFMQNINLID